MKIYKKYFGKYKIPFIISIFCVICEALCDLLGPTFMARIIDEGIAAGKIPKVAYWGGFMLLFTAIGAVFAVCRSVLSSHVSQRIGADLRHDLFAKIMNFSEAGADKIESGSLITRMTNDTTQITQFVNGLMRVFLKAPITCIGSIVLASMLNLKLSIVIYGVVIIITVLIVISMKLSYPRFALLQKAMDRVNSVVQEYLIGVRLVKAFGTYDEETGRFIDANSQLMQRGISTQMIITLIAPIMNLVVGIGTAIVIFAGSKLFMAGEVMPGNISAFTMYMAQMLGSLMMLTNIFNAFVRTKASTARIKEVLDAESDFQHGGGSEELSGDVSFENVTFSYPNGSDVAALDDLSFQVKQGESLAIIGPTGSGKSTICWLLLRFYDVLNGRITVGGKNIKDLDVDTLRKNVAIVPQNPMLFSGSVAENIRWGKPNAADSEVEIFANKAQAQFIKQMEGGYESTLGSSGVNISGGQKQRISIARGMIKNAPILILDDATSALDSVTEAHVRDELKILSQDHTVITVTQRCTTAMFFDKILVIENGKRVGFGTHKELLAGCGTYRDIYQSQVDSNLGGAQNENKSTPPAANMKMPSFGGHRGGGGGGGNRFAPGEKPKNAKNTIARIIKIYMKFGKPVIFAIFLTAVSSAIAVAIPYFVGRTFNTFETSTLSVNTPILIKLLLIIIGLYIANWAINTTSGVMLLKVTQKLVFVLRSEFFAKMQKLPLSFYDKTPHGDTMSRLTNDVDNISSTLAQMTTQLVSSVLTIVGSLAIMLTMNIPLTLAVLICIPMVFFLTKMIAKKSRKYFSQQQRNLGALNGIIEENIQGLKMVKAFGRQKDVMAGFDEINERLYESSKNAQICAGFMMPLMNVINNLIFAVVAIAGGVLSISGNIAIGTVVSFLSYSKHFGQPLNAVAGMFNTIQSALAGAERVFELLDKPTETPDIPNAIDMQSPKGEVEFRDVCFSYDANRPILKHVSFKVNAGETIALVGETGAGKTTIVNLLTRFYDADSGTVLLDGIDIKNVKRNSLRSCFSVVLQDTCLFTGSIMNNIRYSKPSATDEQVMNAAKTARAHDFIEKLPNSYETMVSGSMDNLSQGQRQLLAIARAVLCDSPVLILDEATSSVDTKTEKEIQRALLNLMKNHTSFLIAHRLSTIRDADRIMVIGDGKIKEIGNHQTLMAQKGEYYKMVISQMGTVTEN